MHYLLDADVYLHRILNVLVHDIQWDTKGDIWTTHVNMEEARVAFDQTIKKVTKDATDGYTLCFSDSGDPWRLAAYPGYKQNRKDTKKPVGFGALKEYAIGAHKSVIWKNLEADDVLGLIATDPKWGGKTIMVSEDKDLLTIPGRLILRGKPVHTSLEEANYNWMMQTLCGDAVDGYPGLKGYGVVKAGNLLEDTHPNNYWAVTKGAFRKAGETEEFALSQARCARILRHGEYDFDNKKVNLWNAE